MEETYGVRDLSHYMNGRPIFPNSIPQIQTQVPRDLHYAMVMLGGGGGMTSFGSDSTMGMGSTNSGINTDNSGGGGGGLEMEVGGYGGRWTREETLTLLEIRSGLDSMFKEANHKGPVWDEVSRIMAVEHGYRRTGKKCSEKFENLYKYYKKIKGGKAGRQDKKHYRFFNQLEAIYGETNANSTNHHEDTNNLPSESTNPHLPNNPSVFDFDPNSSNHYAPLIPPFKEDHSDSVEKTSNKKKYWKTMITDFIEKKAQTLMEKQDAWMEKMMKTIDEKEKERISKEKQWRKETAARLEMEKKFRANERAWMESRESALMEALHRLTANKSIVKTSSSPDYCNHDQNYNVADWGENEIMQLIQLRTNMETRFEQSGCTEEGLWEEIAFSMTCLGYNRNAMMCKAKWDHINFQLRNKKRKENTTRCSNLYSHDHNNYDLIHQGGERSVTENHPQNDGGGGYRVVMNDPEVIGNYYGNNKIINGQNY